MSWAHKYEHIPFMDHGRGADGVDCYGMGYLVLKEEANVIIPTMVDLYEGIEDVKTIKKIILEETSENGDWVSIEPGKEQEFDFVICRIIGLPIHVGIVTRKGWMFHTIDGVGASEVQYTKGEWRTSGKIIGFYRRKELCKT